MVTYVWRSRTLVFIIISLFSNFAEILTNDKMISSETNSLQADSRYLIWSTQLGDYNTTDRK
jgi:hypothetical protein